jgi:hypothetical protein
MRKSRKLSPEEQHLEHLQNAVRRLEDLNWDVGLAMGRVKVSINHLYLRENVPATDPNFVDQVTDAVDHASAVLKSLIEQSVNDVQAHMRSLQEQSGNPQAGAGRTVPGANSHHSHGGGGHTNAS